MNFYFALLAKYQSPVVKLSEISKEYLGIEPKTAEQKAKAESLPIPTFKMRNSERSPTLVNIEDLAKVMQKQYEESQQVWGHVNS